ncbi:unnamed protein product [Clonostachys byssicola]|uniref:F-box domain-containing protein n=1 Tax=Clonostachys byssicola TaxID=160290 RepID=A0A9N9UGB9_9HYPO|nr:unnamed protein product [Clonostachys byssicola]
MKLTKKLSGWLQKWGFYTDTRRKNALQKWKQQTEASIFLLEKEFDPLIARAVFNQHRSSVLYKLPDEAWVQIFGLLYQDEISFFIIRQVCRRFRRLLQSRELRHHRFSPVRSYGLPNSQNGGYLFLKSKGAVMNLVPSPAFLHEPEADAALRANICHLLHIDTFCNDCLKSDKRRRSGKLELDKGYCKFLGPGKQYYCHVCAASHPYAMFSREGKKQRTCNGVKGHVRVCEHQTISWSQMRSFLGECKAKIPRTARPDFEVEITMKACGHSDHLSHRTECHPFEVNGPAARLFYKKSGEWRVELTWEPQSGPGKFKLYQPGKFDAGEMRERFLSYRSSAARFIVPALLPNHLPEMTCFRLNECDCLSYGTDEEEILCMGSLAATNSPMNLLSELMSGFNFVHEH